MQVPREFESPPLRFLVLTLRLGIPAPGLCVVDRFGRLAGATPRSGAPRRARLFTPALSRPPFGRSGRTQTASDDGWSTSTPARTQWIRHEPHDRHHDRPERRAGGGFPIWDDRIVFGLLNRFRRDDHHCCCFDQLAICSPNLKRSLCRFRQAGGGEREGNLLGVPLIHLDRQGRAVHLQ